MDAPAKLVWYIRKLANATGPHARSNHGLNLPFFVAFVLSAIRPIAVSVNASTTLATRNIVPTSAALIPRTSV